jgi:hypothetical protein
MRVVFLGLLLRSVVLTNPNPADLKRELSRILSEEGHDSHALDFNCREGSEWENSPFGPIQLVSSLAVTDGSKIFNAYSAAFDHTMAPSSSSSGIPLYSLLKKKRKADVLEGGGTDKANLVIKYTNDYSARRWRNGAIHPLLHEYAFLKVLQDSGIVPKTYFLSGASNLPSVFPPCQKVRSMNLRDAHLYQERVTAGTQVRFMVQAKVGPSVNDYFKRLNQSKAAAAERNLVVNAVAIAIKSLDLIRRLHEHGIIHGDIHGGNIAFKNPLVRMTDSLRDLDLVLIDFGHAVFFPDQIGTPEKVPPDLSLTHWYLSPWQLRNFRKGRRDDVIRVIDQMADWLSNGGVRSGFDALCSRGSSDLAKRLIAADIKEHLTFFKPSALLKSQALEGRKFFSPAKKREIQDRLELIRSSVFTSCIHPDSTILYSQISTDLDSILSIL